MSHCVPDWDENCSGDLIVSGHSSNLPSSAKGGGFHQLHGRKAAYREGAHVPNHDPGHLTLLEKRFNMQGENNRGARQQHTLWTPGASSQWPAQQPASEHGGLLSKTELGDKDGTLDAIVHESIPAVDVPLSNLSFQDDEMVSWLQYPLDDSLERNYCSDFFGNLPNPHVQLLKDSFAHHQPLRERERENPHGTAPAAGSNGRVSPSQAVAVGDSGTAASVDCGVENRIVSVDAAMALGAGRAAGVIPQAGAEAFNIVRTTKQHPSMAKSPHSVTAPNNSKGSDAPPFLSHPPSNGNPVSHENPLGAIVTSVETPKALDVATVFNRSSQQPKSGTLNFSHFSRPVAETKANLHFVGASSGPTSIGRVRQQFGKPRKEGLVSCESSIADSTTTVMSGMDSSTQADLQLQAGEASQCTSTPQGWHPPPSPLCKQEVDKGKVTNLEQNNCFTASMSGSALTASEKGKETLETADFTATSPSRGSGNSTDKSGKEAATTSKRKISHADESEYQSEDVEEVVANAKKPPSGRSGVTKRSRAAEIHNLSERRRRDRINEKMKALQELIPNANKTDKASMLDEAIEYLKMLQSQLQLVSMRTGMVIPPMMMPMGMQHMPMQQMPALPHMGMGMGLGMGMGMGMGMIDVGGAAAGRAVAPLPPHPGQAHPGPAPYATSFQPSSSSLGINEAHDRLQSSTVMEPYNAYLAHPQLQPMHFNMQMNLDIYNAFMHQQQQQWQQQQQQPQPQPQLQTQPQPQPQPQENTRNKSTQ